MYNVPYFLMLFLGVILVPQMMIKVTISIRGRYFGIVAVLAPPPAKWKIIQVLGS